ncbi:MAG: transporter [Devosia sp.]|nr:transporter [Devosia sp.]
MNTEASFCPPDRRIYVLVAAILASSMGFIDGSVISIATPAIRDNLGASLAEAQWVSNAYLLMLASVLLLGGAVGDRFGIRNVFAGGIVLFVVASMASAIAPSAGWLIAARAVQGLGAAFMVPSSLAIIARAYPKAERGAAIGIWSSASSFFTIAGPVIGGLLLTGLGDWSWRLIFAINLPLGGVALALLFLKVPADQPDPDRRLDWGGAVFGTASLLLLALALTGEDTAPTTRLLLGAGGIVLAGVFLWWESRTKMPMLPLGLFRDRAFSGAQGLTFALYFSLAAITFYLPMTLISGWGVTPAEVSVVLLPLGILLTVLSPFSGRFADRLGPGPMIAAGATLVALAFLLLGLLIGTHNLWFVVLPLMIVFGIGMSLVVSPLSTAVMTSVADRDTGTASGVNNAVARVAGLFAVATMGGLGALVFAASLGGQPGDLSFGMPPTGAPDAALETARIAATDHAFAAIAYVTAALSLLSGIIAWTTLERRSPRPAGT